MKLPFWIRKGSRATLEGAVREQGGALEGAGGAAREQGGALWGSAGAQQLPQYSDLAAEKTLNPKVSPKYSLKLGRR